MPLKLAVKNSQIHCHRLPLWRKYAPEVKAAKWLKRCRTNVKGVNNPAWTAQYWHAVDAKLCNTSLSFMLHFLIVYATFPCRVCYISLSCMLHVLAVYATLRSITVSFMIHENNALTCMQYCLLMHDVLIALSCTQYCLLMHDVLIALSCMQYCLLMHDVLHCGMMHSILHCRAWFVAYCSVTWLMVNCIFRLHYANWHCEEQLVECQSSRKLTKYARPIDFRSGLVWICDEKQSINRFPLLAFYQQIRIWLTFVTWIGHVLFGRNTYTHLYDYNITNSFEEQQQTNRQIMFTHTTA